MSVCSLGKTAAPIQANSWELMWRVLICFQAHILSGIILWKVIVSLVHEIIQIKVMKVLQPYMVMVVRWFCSHTANPHHGQIMLGKQYEFISGRGSSLRMVNWRNSHPVFIFYAQPSVRKQSQVFENELLLNLSLHVYVKHIVIRPFIFHLHYSWVYQRTLYFC